MICNKGYQCYFVLDIHIQDAYMGLNDITYMVINDQEAEKQDSKLPADS